MGQEIDSYYGSSLYFKFQIIGVTPEFEFTCKHIDGTIFAADLFVGCALPLRDDGSVDKEYCESFIGKWYEGDGHRCGTWLASEDLKEVSP